MAELIKPPLQYNLFDIHKSLGVTVWGLAFLRIVIRLVSDVPPMPPQVRRYERTLAKIVYACLYVLMIGFPLSGYIMSSAGGHPVAWFGVNIPLIIEKNKHLSHLAWQIHSLFGYALLGLITLHFLGFLKHLIFDRENLLKRMW